MPNDSKTYILDDQWTDNDALDFTPYVETLANIIQTGNTPLTIGVFGTWGSGKTSLMRMIKNGIPESEYKGLPNDYTVVWFDAWKYDKEATLWRVLLLSVLAKVKETAKSKNEPLDALEQLETMLYRAVDIEKVGGVKIDLLKLGGLFAKGTVQLGLSFIPGGAVLGKFVEEVQKSGTKALTDDFTQAIQRERTKIHIEQVYFLEQFQDKFKELIKQFIEPNRLVVFVDDLDRCLPEKAVEVLEAIKLFLDVKNCVFVLGLDQGVIARGIEMKYREFGDKKDVEGQARFTIEGNKYLEKIIQLPFQIPPVESTDMSNFVHGLSAEWPHEECPKIFAEGLGDNPRQIKRTVNVFLMLWKLAERRKEKLEGLIKPIRLAKVVTIQAIFPELYSLIKDEPRYLGELEDYFRTLEFGGVINTEDGKEVVEIQKEPPPALVPFVSKQAVERILTMHLLDFPDANFVGLKPDELKLYFTLTRRAESPQPAPSSEAARLLFEPQMIRVPAGRFIMGSSSSEIEQAKQGGFFRNWVSLDQPQHEVELSEYLISKYPITNREYQAFIRESAHTPPRGWDGDQYPSEKGDHPVVNVSWGDATAYCRWLRGKTKKLYTLPTEAEWEKAARVPFPLRIGELQMEEKVSLIWPWGDEPHEKNANVLETGIGDTTPVGQFSPQGDSSFGCADMAGNVWEWCYDWYDENVYKNRENGVQNPLGSETGKNRVLRGGSFDFDIWYARSDCRGRYPPNYLARNLGFRVAISLTTSPYAKKA